MRQLLPEARAAVDLHAAYAVPAARHVRANMVTSADGAATLDGLSGGLSGPADKRVFATLRDLCDVVLVGAGTVRSEGYGPARPSEDRQARRTALGLAAVPPIAVVSASLELDPTSRLFTDATARPLLVTCERAPAARRARMSKVSDVVVAGDALVDPARALDLLADRGLSRVLCEGGPTLLGDLATAGRLDELCLSVAPVLSGGTGRRIVAGPPLPMPAGLSLVHVLAEDGFLFCRYAVARRNG